MHGWFGFVFGPVEFAFLRDPWAGPALWFGPGDAAEAELTVAEGSEGELEFEAAGLEAELALETLDDGRVAVSFEAVADDEDEDDDEDDDNGEDEGPEPGEQRFVFAPEEGLEESFEIEVGGQAYRVELEAELSEDDEDDDGEDDDGDDTEDDDDGEDDDREIEAEVEITPVGPTPRGPLEAELELEVARGEEAEGDLEYRGLEIGLEIEPDGSDYVAEVEIEHVASGRVFEEEFRFNPDEGFEREFEAALGGRVYELELAAELDREDDEIAVSLEVEQDDAGRGLEDFLAHFFGDAPLA